MHNINIEMMVMSFVSFDQSSKSTFFSIILSYMNKNLNS